MEKRFEVRKKELQAECEVGPEVFEGMMGRLREFVCPFADLLVRQEQKEHAQVFVEGLLSDVKRKNTEGIAYQHEEGRMNLQRFIGWSRWDHGPLAAELARQVGEELGEPDGVVVFDPSAHPKQGKESVGVKRQWCGRLGKVENCQVGIYMGYVSRKGHALVDERLYLPREWAADKERRKKCGVPKGVRYCTRHDLALEMLREQGDLLPHAWVAGDDEMGRSSRFRRRLRDSGERYLLAVPSNTGVRDLEGAVPEGRRKRPFERVESWRGSVAEEAWARIEVRDGEKGPLVVEAVKTRVVARTDRRRVGPEEVLFVTRGVEDDGTVKHDYYLSNAPADTPIEELARVAKAENRVEDCIKRAKDGAGLSDYEVRSWAGWHHHQTLSIIATWFLMREARRGKKLDAGDNGAAGRMGARDAAA